MCFCGWPPPVASDAEPPCSAGGSASVHVRTRRAGKGARRSVAPAAKRVGVRCAVRVVNRVVDGRIDAGSPRQRISGATALSSRAMDPREMVRRSGGASEWDVILSTTWLGKKYQVARVVNKKAQSLGEYATLEEAALAVEGPTRRRSRSRRRDSALLQSAARCRNAVAERSRRSRAMAARGAQPPSAEKRSGHRGWARGSDVVVRLLGGEKRHYEARTGRSGCRTVADCASAILLRTADFLRTAD